MRAGGCTVQQGLTAEATSVVKQAVTLAKRRGHAQVTPLHVANTMLSASTGLLRTACLQSHSHPLQCKALELCFNVALNRLPASNSSPMLGAHHSHHPSISNALVAAFKRAQAHQRRGSIENQQQPLLAVKIELEQLIISILDDPSVSRVMREAGFSSTQVKSNVEQAVSLEICSQTQSQTAPSVSSNKSKESNLLVLSQSPTISQQVGSNNNNNNKVVGNPVELSDPIIRNEDVESVVESLLNRRRKSIVVVGECLASIEGVVRGVKDKVDKEDVPEALREVKFISLSLSSFGQHSRVQVEQKLVELKNLLRSCVGKGVILYLGDLKWTTEYRACSSEQGRGYYCPVEHMIMELGKLVCGIGENAKFWLMGIATFQTYMRCKSGHPSLETVWGIHPLTIPAGSLRLSLVTADSDPKSESTSKTDKNGTNSLIVEVGGGDKQLTCCAECSAKFEVEARSFQSTSCNSDSTTSTLPAWLQHCKNETKLAPTNDQHNSCVPVSELCKKWNSICNSMHRQPNCSEKTLTFSSVSPSSSASGFSYEQQNPNYLHQSQSWREHHFWIPADNKTAEPSLRMYIPEHNNNNKEYPKQPFLSSNPNSTPTSASSSDAMETEYSHKFKELNAENLKTLCNALERKVPWQKDIIPEIASTILKCRSGMVRRKEKVVVQAGNNNINEVKEETWLFFQGVDMEAKEKIARELAKLVFGSQTNLLSIALSSFSSTRADSTDDYCRNKRSRDEQSCSYIERFADAVSHNPHRVFLIEDVEQADYCSQMGFKRAMERGRITNSSGEEAGLGDAIIILSCESFSSRSRACSPPIKQKSDDPKQQQQEVVVTILEETSSSPCVSLDLNISFDDNDDDNDNDNDSADQDHSIDDIGLLESVDRRIIFKIQEL